MSHWGYGAWDDNKVNEANARAIAERNAERDEEISRVAEQRRRIADELLFAGQWEGSPAHAFVYVLLVTVPILGGLLFLWWLL